MPGSLSEAIKEAYATAAQEVIFLDTLEISNPDVPPLFLVNDRVDHDFTLEDGTVKTFVSTGFQFILPEVGDNGVQSLSLSIDNVDLRPSDFVKSIIASQSPVQVTYRPYMSTDLTTPQMNPPLVLFLTDIVVTAITVSGTATFADILNRDFLTELYTRRRFPAL